MTDAIRVLYVDDEKDLLEIGKLFLEESGEFSVTTIASAPAALELLNTEKFDAIVSDYQMPVMNGIQFLVEVRTGFGNIPFILFTGKGREEVVIQAINSGADFYLQKGGEPESQFAELSQKIKSAALRNRAEEALLKSTEELHAAYEELAATDMELRSNLDELTLQEQALRESEGRFRLLFQNMGAIFSLYEVVLDKNKKPCDYRYLEVNSAYEKITNMRASELIGKTLLEVFPSTEQYWIDKFEEVYITGIPTRFEQYSIELGTFIELNLYTPQKGQLAMISLDITERKLAEEVLLESEEKYRTVFENAGDAIAIHNLNGHLIEVNDIFCRRFGYSLEELLTMKVGDVDDPVHARNIEGRIQELIKNGHIVFETVHITRDGRKIPTEASAVLFHLANKPLVMSIARDITGRKRTEEALLKNTEELRIHQVELETQAEELRQSHLALEESRDKYLDLYEFAPIGYFTLTDKELIIEVNLTGATLLGVERSKLIKARFRKFVTEKDSDQWIQYFMQILNQMEKQICNLTLTRGDDSLFHARLEGERLTNSEGVIMIRIAFSDITESKRVEEALYESEQKLTNVLESVVDVIWSLSWPDMKLYYISPSVEQLFGRTIQEYIEKPSLWAEVTHPDDKHISEKALEQLLKVGTAARECRIVRPDGSIAWIHDKSHLVFDNHGTPVRVDGVSSDITERKQTEDALSQANKKLNLLSGITRHDLKNKVITIQGFLRFARKAKDIHEIQPFLDKIQDSAKAIEHQIDFTKDYQDLGVKSPKWLNLSNMIVFASNPAIHIFDETGTLQIFADPLFEKVMYNLIDNTIRHGETATEVHVSVITDKDDIRIIWVDNGVGVPADQKEMIFNRGYGKNTGFGLFLIREILAITGMTIRETGEPGKGARFEIAVPNGKWRYGSGES